MENYNPPDSKIIIDLQGTPIAKQGQKSMVTKTGKIHKWIDSNVTNFANWVRLQAQISMGNRPPLVGPLILEVEFRFSWPKTMSKKQRALIESWPHPYRDKRPDRDNLLKNFQDALNGVLYVDDNQVVGGDVRKVYHNVAGIYAVAYPVE